MQIPLIWIYFAAGFALATLFLSLFFAFMSHRFSKRCESKIAKLTELKDADIAYLKESLAASDDDCERLEHRLLQAKDESAHLLARAAGLSECESRLQQAESEVTQLQKRNVALEKEVSELATRLEEERRGARLRMDELKEAKDTMQKEFKALASQIMEENSRRFGDLSKERVEAVLKPLQQQVHDFRRRIDAVHSEETKEMAALLTEVKTLKELNQRIGEEAHNLTRALKGESKKQGIWGEMVLERVLEASGLRKGEEYEREVSLKDEQNRRFRPDVVVHLPDDRDIVIDAKTSLKAYERYVNAQTPEEQARYATMHVASIRGHIKELSDKRYANLSKIHTLDFVFMFMPIEGALTLALEKDPSLYDEAFKKHIVLVSPTTLLVALRAVENTWKHARQSRNAMKIAAHAGALYDKFVGFIEDMEKIGKQLSSTQKSYEAAWSKLSAGRGNLVSRAMELEELGAKTAKRIPKELADSAKED